jgi:predicted KAP-like P-loop ATPase
MIDKRAILSDTPLVNPKEDRLGYAPFARNLSEAICEFTTNECLVFALYGQWGSGKTSCLNFVEYYVSSKPKEQVPIIVHFNPWWFSGQGELLYQFFREFSAAIGKKEKLKDISNLIADFAAIFGEIPEPSGFLKLGGKAIAIGLKRRLREASKIRNDIIDFLQKKELPILAIIDDIDRLQKITEDDKFNGLELLQKVIDDYSKKIDEIAAAKEKEILER